MTKSRKLKGYFAWLCEFIAKPREVRKYYSLLNLLYSQDFKAVIKNDENRIADAYSLREQYEDLVKRKINTEITVLELLVSFAMRANSAMSVECTDWDEVHDLFWDMISNMGMMAQTEEYFYEEHCIMLINNMINRMYMADGSNGGLFVIKNPPEDLRKVEIWWQYQWWVTRKENYDG